MFTIWAVFDLTILTILHSFEHFGPFGSVWFMGITSKAWPSPQAENCPIRSWIVLSYKKVDSKPGLLDHNSILWHSSVAQHTQRIFQSPMFEFVWETRNWIQFWASCILYLLNRSLLVDWKYVLLMWNRDTIDRNRSTIDKNRSTAINPSPPAHLDYRKHVRRDLKSLPINMTKSDQK